MDSQQDRKAVLTGITTSSLEEVRAVRTLTQKAHTIAQVRWVSAHSGIQGNVEADATARAALRRLPIQDVEPELITSAHLHRLMNQRRQALLDGFLEEPCLPRYRDLDLLMRRRKPLELALPRRQLLELIATHTGHGNFAAHHRRFNNLDAIMECPCGGEMTPTHFIHCQRNAHHLRRLRGAMPLEKFIKKLLGLNCLESFKLFAQKTGCFEIQPVTLSTALSVDQEEILT
ncbi:hypothetical protein K3495_g3579 [Podosphaera aphanis]|nr:hypothetical protein K3495_g3579 [Podosphaera aphanis]